MTKRMVDSGMWSNENFAALPAMARLLQIGIINHADDQGRIKAHPAYLRSQIFPYDDVSIDDITKWLKLIVANGTATTYAIEGKSYIQLINWWDYQSLQYASPSEYPSPQGWDDRIRYNAKGGMVLTHNWATSKGEVLPDTCDSKGNVISTQKEATLALTPDNSPEVPPEYPGETPPGNPPGSINKDQLNTNKDQECGSAREAVSHRQPPQNTRTRADVAVQQTTKYLRRSYPDIKPKLLTDLTNHVKRIYGFDALIDRPGDDTLENKMRDEAYRLWVLGFNSDEEMIYLKNSWNHHAVNFSDKRPYGNQLYELAVRMISGSREAVPTNNSVLDFELEEILA